MNSSSDNQLAFYPKSHGSLQNEESSSMSKMPRPLSLTKSPVEVLRVAYQGLPGAYGESAAVQAYPNCKAMPCEQLEAAFESVEVTNAAERIMLPLENSIGGSIHRNYDLLLRHSLHIIGEVRLPVSHCLLSMHGVTPHELVRVISHQQAFAQCEHTLTKMLGGHVAHRAVDNTAGAAQFVSAQALRDTAAIASARAAKLYGLQVMAESIQDDANNVTRFVVLAREPIMPRSSCPFKTSIVVAHHESTRILFKVVAAFAFRRINLTKIESRPQRKRPLRLALLPHSHDKYQYFEYLFYIDFEASMADPHAQNALAEIQEFVTFLRVLGSYPMDTTPLNFTQVSLTSDPINNSPSL